MKKSSIKKVYTPSVKNTPKKKLKTCHKMKLSPPLKEFDAKTKVKSNLNSTRKNKKFKTTIEQSKNPSVKISHKIGCLAFQRQDKINNEPKKKIKTKASTDIFDDSYLNNLLLANGSDSNRYEQSNEAENKFPNGEDSNYDHLFELFKKSNLLKSTIVIDKNGNNNLDLEQRKIIDNYFFKFNKGGLNLNDYEENKINTIPVQKYKDNNKLFIQNRPMSICFGNNTRVKKCLDFSRKRYNGKNSEAKNKFFGKKDETDEFSNYEACTNRSIDSSFLGSCLNDTFYQELALNKNYF